jgi:hypothetical protein
MHMAWRMVKEAGTRIGRFIPVEVAQGSKVTAIVETAKLKKVKGKG